MESRLTLVRRIPKTRPVRAIFRCVCGAEKEFALSNVMSGASRSCGCLAREVRIARMAEHRGAFSQGNRRHGKFHTGAHVSWSDMIQRCTNPKRDNYPYYGGRGISVCERWLTFENFFADMGERPIGTTLDRVENDGNYEPGNCRWATKVEQSNNRRPRGTAHHAAG